ncbi:pitrilysin family protein [Candidatus Kapaibacterium sp.]
MSGIKIFKYSILMSIGLMTLFSTQLISSEKFKPISFTRDSLENGLVVIYHIDKSAPVVSTIMHYKVGSKDENPSLTGFAHFFEHLMFEATDKIPRSELDEMIQSAGGRFNAHTAFDETVYYIDVPSNQLPLALWIESQRIRKLKVDEIGVETQRGVIQEERKQRTENQPYGMAFDKIMANLFPSGSYSWTPIGSKEHIANATLEQFKKFYDNFYQPNNATLVISGDFDIATARKYVDSYFAKIPGSPMPKREKFVDADLKQEVRDVIKDKLAQLPAVFVGYKGPSMLDSMYYATQVLNAVLSSGESSRLYKKLIDETQEAVSASIEMVPMEKSGMFLFVGISGPGKSIGNVESLFYKEIENLIKNGITDEELTKAKNIFEAEFVESKKSASSKARTLASYQSYYGQPDLINSELDKYLTVSKLDVVNAAKRFLDTKNKLVLVFEPALSN